MKNNNNLNLDKIPQSPGVYLFKKNQSVLYVGKAKNLKNRVKQYFEGRTNSYKTPILIQEVNDIDFIVCSNEKEALLLEQELIKKYKPFFNILFLDDKKYPYLVVELKRDRLEIKTKFFWKDSSTSYYYGPLPSNFGYQTIKKFLIRECMYENGLPIINKNQEFWKEKFLYAKQILSSNNKFIISKLKEQMIKASEMEQYELAKDFRDIITHLSQKSISQSIKFNNNDNFDVIAFYKKDNYIVVVIHHFFSGAFFMQEDFVIEIILNFETSITEFLNNFYLNRNKPDFLLMNFKLSEEIIFNRKIIVPKQGKYFQALNNALENAKNLSEIKILEYRNKLQISNKVKQYLMNLLNREINDFLMIDNSNESNKEVVSVFIYYKNFKPLYSNYRKYKILQSQINRKADVEYMKIGILKYLDKCEELPDLVIVDGGKAQLNEVKKIFLTKKVSIPIIGLIKDNNHQTKWILTEKGNKIILDDKQILNFMSRVQTEVDEFAKNYHKKLKLTSSLEGFLSTIKGIGPKTEEKLLDYFKNYNNIYNASENELSKVVSRKLAQKIIEKLEK